MKKMIRFLTATLIFTKASGFAQVINNGFETWNNMGTYDNPAQWGTMNNTTSALGIFTAEKGTPGTLYSHEPMDIAPFPWIPAPGPLAGTQTPEISCLGAGAGF